MLLTFFQIFTGFIGAVVNESLLIESAGCIFSGNLGWNIFIFEGNLKFATRDGDFLNVAVFIIGASDNIREWNFLNFQIVRAKKI